MMTANEARSIAIPEYNARCKRKLVSLMSCIEEQAEKGEFSYSTTGTLDPMVREKLEELGYTLTEGTNTLGYHVTKISWLYCN